VDHHRRPHLLAAPDAFKGTADASALAEGAAEAARGAGWEASACPLSDGGEGFAEVIAAARPGERRSGGAAWRRTRVCGPLGAPVVARWWMAEEDAVVESAAASGLPLAGGAAGNDAVAATTRGTGELIVAACSAGARRVLVGVGGSATTDGGRGAVEVIEAAGGLGAVEVVVACDVSTRFVDAAARFGPQKGATPAQVRALTSRLTDYAAELRSRFGVDVTEIPGAGAAGGLAGGLVALGARLAPGFDVVAGEVGLAGRVAAADLVLTGEGRLDATSWAGKVVDGVVGVAAGHGVPVVVMVGTVGPGGLEGARRAPGSPIEVVSLSERVGEARAVAEPVASLAEAVTDFLRSRPPGQSGGTTPAPPGTSGRSAPVRRRPT
jgi:glycerate kinase